MRKAKEYSDIEATAPTSSEDHFRCQKIYPSVYETSVQVFQRILSNQNIRNQSARQLAKHTRTMLTNMTLNKENPIHPAGFFAVVKDFESGSSLRWGRNNFDFTTGNCTSGVCSGLFQVDVNLEHAWNLQGICGSGGLNILGLPGGPDYCASLFWWNLAEGGRKCPRLNPGGADPCKSPGHAWSSSTFVRGPAVYVQAVQPRWGSDQWKVMYDGRQGFKGYKTCVEEHYLGPVAGGQTRIQAAVEDYLSKIGLENHCKKARATIADGSLSLNIPTACAASKFKIIQNIGGKKYAVGATSPRPNSAYEFVFTEFGGSVQRPNFRILFDSGSFDPSATYEIQFLKNSTIYGTIPVK